MFAQFRKVLSTDSANMMLRSSVQIVSVIQIYCVARTSVAKKTLCGRQAATLPTKKQNKWFERVVFVVKLGTHCF